MSLTDLTRFIRNIPDFPVPGVLFRDITPLLAEPVALHEAVVRMADPFRGCGVTDVVGVEARGFVFGVLVAQQLTAGFVPIRKAGKLPAATIRNEYELEYGRASLEIHRDAFAARPEPAVLLVDDVLATGGTAVAAIDLVRRAGGRVVGASFLVELVELGGRQRLEADAELTVASLIRY